MEVGTIVRIEYPEDLGLFKIERIIKDTKGNKYAQLRELDINKICPKLFDFNVLIDVTRSIDNPLDPNFILY